MKGFSLGIYLTLDHSLEKWERTGLLAREMALYGILAQSFDQLVIFSYGSDCQAEQQIASRFGKNISVLCRPAWMPGLIYSWIGPLLHRKVLRGVNFHKSNQSLGAWAALMGSRLGHGVFAYRSGYVWSHHWSRMAKVKRLAPLARWIEKMLLQRSSVVIVTSQQAEEYFRKLAPTAARRVHCLPNYVDTVLFSPDWQARRMNRVIFVGNNKPQKNFSFVLEALAGTEIEIDVVGGGYSEEKYVTAAQAAGVKANFTGPLPNETLPSVLNQANILLLPSLYEGYPKAPLEAMSCGVPVIGFDIPGVTEIIEPGENGLILARDANVWQREIEALLANPARLRQMGQSARAWAERNSSLQKFAEQEMNLYATTIGDV